MVVDGLVDTDGAQTVEPIQFDVGGENMHGVIAIRDWDEEIEHISFIFLISFWCLPSSLPLHIPSVGVFRPVLVDFFQTSRMHLVLCQLVALLLEYFELFLVVAANFLIFSHNSRQSLCNEEEFLPTRGPMSFESSMH